MTGPLGEWVPVVLLGSRTNALAFRPSAAKASRRIVADAFLSWNLDLDVETAQSCTSELVTNALKHGRSPLHLVIQRWTDCVHVTVMDGAVKHEGSPELGSHEELRVRWRILLGLTARWGVERVPTGTAAWFDIDTRPGSGVPAMDARAIAGAEWLASPGRPLAGPGARGRPSVISCPP